VFVGHSAVAFVLVVVGASAATAVTDRRYDRRRVLALAFVAGAFAAVPDADVVYALWGVITSGFGDAFAVAAAFWAASSDVHRTMTHSLVVAPVAAVAFAAVAHRGRRARLAHAFGVAVLAAVTAFAAVTGGALGLVVFAAFAATGLAVATVVREHTTLPTRSVGAAALVGLASHPVGDVFTGVPPAMVWPLEATVLAERVALSPDPTLHLLGAFAIELAVVALALHVYARLTDRRLDVSPRATAGVAYGALVLAMPPPTLDVSYHFVFSILGVGVVATTPHLYRARVTDGGEPARDHATPTAAPTASPIPGFDVSLARVERRARASVRRFDHERVLDGVATGVVAVGFALLAYATGYLVLP
jgi:membrane-bound metal-dependent hydrolase YbcI (DUF457 family)